MCDSDRSLIEISLDDAVVFEPGDILLFYDKKHPADYDSDTRDLLPVNRIAVLLGVEGALSYEKRAFRRRVQFIPGKEIATFAKNPDVRQCPLHQHRALVVSFFRKHRNNPAHFMAGLAALW